MKPKEETLIIKLDKDTKEAFRKLCESHNTNMSHMVLEQIKKMIISNEANNETSNFESVIKEKNFYKEEFLMFKSLFIDVNKKINTYNKDSSQNWINLFCEMFLEHFDNIKEFAGYVLQNKNYKNNPYDFLAINKETKSKLLIEFVSSSIEDIPFLSKERYYKQLYEQFKDKHDLKLVLVSLKPINEDSVKNAETLSERIKYDVELYDTDNLFSFLTEDETI